MQSLKGCPRLLFIKVNSIRYVSVQAAAGDVEQNEAKLKSYSEIPGPKSLPFIGPLLNFLPGGELHNITGIKLFNKLHNKYGSILKLDGVLGKPDFVSLTDPESVALVLRGESTQPLRKGLLSLEYYRRKHNKTPEQSQKPSGLLTEQYERWQNIRTTVNPVMMQPRTIKLYSSTIDQVALEFIERLRSRRNEDNMFDGKLDFEMNLWALESVGVIALGSRLNCLDPNLPEDSPVKQLIDCVHETFKIMEDIEFKLSLWHYYPTPLFKKAMKAFEEQERLIKYFIDKAIESYQDVENKTANEKSVLEKLLEKDRDIAYIMASDMLFAGVDTTSNSILGALYLLSINPDKQDKLREEILGGKKERPYLSACLKEAMRIMPVASLNARETTKEYNILGYKIPIGTGVVFNHHYMSMSPEHYPNPEQFIPERWLLDKDDALSHKNVHPFTTQPFGFGPRMCIGRRIAQLELETLLGRLIENFKIEWKGPPPKINASLINYVLGPYNFVYTDVNI